MPTTKTEKKAAPKRYFEAVGRRKTSVARVRITPGKDGITVNGKALADYFPTDEMRKIASGAFSKTRPDTRMSVSALVKGGGVHSQSEALRHGISRALLKFDAGFRPLLKKAGFLTRDPRVKERRKFGLKKARRAPQWQKR